MAKRKQAAVEANPGLDPENCELLESLMMDYAERRPELEAPLFTIARKCGLTKVANRITRLRRYARTHRGK